MSPIIISNIITTLESMQLTSDCNWPTHTSTHHQPCTMEHTNPTFFTHTKKKCIYTHVL